MTTSTAELSCTIDKVEEADVCQETHVCDICGDVGYDDELVVCSQCNEASQHIYCMAIMHVRVPSQWICERCKLGEQGSLKKRPAGNEPCSTQACKKQNTHGLSTCSTFNEAKNVLIKKPFISCENGADASSALISSIEKHEGRTAAVEACGSPHRQGEAVAILHPVRGSPGNGNFLSSGGEGIKAVSETRTAHTFAITKNVENASKHSKLPSDGLLLSSKCVYSRSLSKKSDMNELPFLLPSRPKNFVRSKSAVVRPSASWTSDKGLPHHATRKHDGQGGQGLDSTKSTQLPSDGLLVGSKCVHSRSVSMKSDSNEPSFSLPCRPKNFVRSKSAVVRSSTWTGDEGLFHHATHKHVGLGLNSTKLTQAQPSLHPNRQAGEDRSREHDRSANDSDSSHSWRHNVDVTKQSINGLPRVLDPIQQQGWNDEETYRCHRCQEMGHIAAMCKSTSQAREWESRRGQGTTEKGRPSTQESSPGLYSNKESGALKESSLWRSHSAVSLETSPKPCQRTPRQEGTPKFEEKATVSPCKREGSLSERSSWDLHRANCPDAGFFNRSQQEESPGKGRFGRRDTVKVTIKNQVSLVQVLHDQDGSSTTSATTWQTQDMDPIREENNMQETEGSPSSLCHKDSRCGSDALMMLIADPDISSDSFSTNKADPCIEMMWSGCFKVTRNNGRTKYKGLQAHPSTKADPRVSEALKMLPSELYLEELKRGRETDTWPRSLHEQPPTSNSIGIYFFPVDMECYDKCYKPLIDHLAANDLALKMDLEWFQLLIFPSQLLPQADQCWEDRQYLWGILRKGTSMKTSSTSATLGVAL